MSITRILTPLCLPDYLNIYLIYYEITNDRLIEFPQGVENMKIIIKNILKRILFNALHYKQ